MKMRGPWFFSGFGAGAGMVYLGFDHVGAATLSFVLSLICWLLGSIAERLTQATRTERSEG